MVMAQIQPLLNYAYGDSYFQQTLLGKLALQTKRGPGAPNTKAADALLAGIGINQNTTVGGSTRHDVPMVPLEKYNALNARYTNALRIIAKKDEVIRSMSNSAGQNPDAGVCAGSQMMQQSDLDVRVNALETALDVTVAAQNRRDIRGDGRDKVWLRMDMVDEYIQDDNLLKTLTGLEPIEFEYTVHLVKEYMEAHGGKLYYNLKIRGSDPGNRSKLKIRYIVFMNFFIKRTNVTLAVAGALFGLHRSNVGRQCRFMDNILKKVLPGATNIKKRLQAIKKSEEFIEFAQRVIMNDGTVTTAPRSHDADNMETSGYSGKHHTPGFNTVLTCIGTGLLADISKTVPGNQHDFRVIKENPVDLGLWHMNGKPENKESARVMNAVTVLDDRGFEGMKRHFKYIKSRTPYKGKNKKSAKEIKAAFHTRDDNIIAAALGLTPEQHAENKSISSERSLIERMIGRLKRWNILVGPFRGTASELNLQFEIITGVVNLGILWPEIQRDHGPLLTMLAKKRARYAKRR